MFFIISLLHHHFPSYSKDSEVAKAKERISQNDGFGVCVGEDKSWSWGSVDQITIET